MASQKYLLIPEHKRVGCELWTRMTNAATIAELKASRIEIDGAPRGVSTAMTKALNDFHTIDPRDGYTVNPFI